MADSFIAEVDSLNGEIIDMREICGWNNRSAYGAYSNATEGTGKTRSADSRFRGENEAV